MNKFLKFIKNISKKLKFQFYYYVPPCPECGSHMTGRYVKGYNSYEADWMINESLRKGELITLVPEIKEKNCYCTECDAEWYSDIKFMVINGLRLEKEIEDRHTKEILQMRYDVQNQNQKEKEANRSAVTNSISRFIGKI